MKINKKEGKKGEMEQSNDRKEKDGRVWKEGKSGRVEKFEGNTEEGKMG